MNDLADRVREAREMMGWSQSELARAVGVPPQSIQQLEAGSVRQPRYLRRLSEVLGFDLDDPTAQPNTRGRKFTLGRSNNIVEVAKTDPDRFRSFADRVKQKAFDRKADAFPFPPESVNSVRVGEKDLPVYSSAQGGPDGAVVVGDRPIEFVKRPEPLFSSPRGFGVLVVGTSMEPAFEQGDTALVHADRPVQHNCDALFINNGDAHGEHQAILKRLLSWDDAVWRVREYEPQRRDFELLRSEWPTAYLVVGKYSRR